MYLPAALRSAAQRYSLCVSVLMKNIDDICIKICKKYMIMGADEESRFIIPTQRFYCMNNSAADCPYWLERIYAYENYSTRRSVT